MKRILSYTFIFLFFLSFVEAQNLIRTNKIRASATDTNFDAEAYFTAEDLVKKVLIPSGNCYSISNVIVYPNINPPLINNYTDTNRGYGYYNKGNSNFPFERGVILSTGYAKNAGNTYSASTLYNELFSSVPGDIDLANALGLDANKLYDTSYIQFDFKAIGNKVKFRYILASEEYSKYYPCKYTDAFALLLKPIGTSTYTNIALLPNGSTVSVTNIHPAIILKNNGCAAINEAYFGSYNPGSSHYTGPTTNATSNFSGQTAILSVEADVIPGQMYTFKFVIADNKDIHYDSAVFLDANFDFGLNFIDDNGIEYQNNNGDYYVNICDENKAVPLHIVGGDPTWNFTWSYDSGNGVFIDIPGALTNSYIATQPGIYRISYSCTPEFKITKDFNYNYIGVNFITHKPILYTPCVAGNNYVNLHEAEPKITSDVGLTFSYFYTMTEAIAGTNEITEPLTSNFLLANSGDTVVAKIKNSNNCTNYATITLNKAIPLNPEISATSTEFCEGSYSTLTSNIASGNTWSTGETTQSIRVYSSGSYTVTATVLNTDCTKTSPPITITKLNNPNLVITNPTTTCNTLVDLSNLSITLGSDNDLTYTYWIDNAATIPYTSYKKASAGTYYIKGTNSNGCFTIKPVIVSINPLPTITGTLTICVENTTQLQGSDTPSLTTPWSSSNPAIATINNTGLVTGISSGVVVITYTNLNGCKQLATITINALPQLIITNPPPTCNSTVNLIQDFITIGSDVGLTYTYWNDANASIALPNPMAVIEGTYYIKGTNLLNGCSTIKPVKVILYSKPKVTVTNTSPICNYQTATINTTVNSSDVFTYIWTVPTGATNPGNVPNFSTSTEGIYKVKVINNTTLCESNTKETEVIANLSPIPNPSLNLEICDEQFNGIFKVDLNGIDKNLIISNAINYRFEFYSDSNGLNQITTNISNYNLGNTLPKIIYVKVIDNQTNCFVITPITFKQLNLSSSLLNAETEIKKCDEDDSPINDGIYEFNLTSVQNQFNTDNSTAFQFYTSLIGAKNKTASDEIIGATNYRNLLPYSDKVYVRIQQSGHCPSIGIINLIVQDIPYDFDLTSPPAICNGQDETIKLEVEDIYTSYQWKDPQGNIVSNTYFVDNIKIAGKYSVTLTNENCTNTQYVEVLSYDLPSIKDVIFGNGFIEITGIGGVPPYEYSYDNGITWTRSNRFSTSLNNTNHTVQVAIRNFISKCIGEIKEIPLIFYPNTFTPNKDGKNDIWEIKGIENFNNAQLIIYDRHGKIIFDNIQTGSNRNLIWEGKYLGRSLPSDTYWYTLQFIDPIKQKPYRFNGFIVLKNR